MSDFLKEQAVGPVAIIVNEDDVELSSTVSYHAGLGFATIIVVGGHDPKLPGVKWLDYPLNGNLIDLQNALMDVLNNYWVLFIFNAEYFFFPFCESRAVQDVSQFMTEERRNSVFCATVDLYTPEVDREISGFDRNAAHFDGSGYYALDRWDAGQRRDREPRIFGGLKWRFAEHVPWTRQHIDRVAFYKARKGLRIDESGRFSDDEMNTIACPWHANLTGVIASWRVAKSLSLNPGSSFAIERFAWGESVPFTWQSDQLMDAGLMEPGQWF